MDELALRQLNGGEDEDEALQRALALSMGESESSNANAAISSHKHVRSASTATTASAASTPSTSPKMAENGSAAESAPESAPAGVAPVTVGTLAPASSLSLLGLDRKAMEAERLARRQKALAAQQPQVSTTTASEGSRAQQDTRPEAQHLKQSWRLHPTPKKRKAEDDVIVIDDSDDESNDSDRNNDTKINETKAKPEQHIRQPPSRKRRLNEDTEGKSGGEGQKPPSAASLTHTTSTSRLSSSTNGKSPSSAQCPFSKGVIKKTWVRGQPRRGDDVTIDEVWQKNELELAVLSSFQWDEDWMMTHIDMRRTRVMLIAYAADERQKEQMKANAGGGNIRFCFPPMQTMGYMHSKLQVLKFPGHLRIVVPTGNLVPYDWGEAGTLENMVFMIDLPKLRKGSKTEGTSTPFLEDISYFLTAQGVDATMVQSLRSYDFTETARYAFVHSIAGSHTDESWKRTGYSGLGRAVNTLGWATNKPIQIDYIASSIGSVSDDLINALYYSCQGDSGLKELEARTSKPRATKGKNAIPAMSSAPSTPSNPKNSLRLYFPSEETVQNSLGGKTKAGTICFQRKWWESPSFPRAILRDGQNVRKGILMHTKLLLARTGSGAGETQPGQSSRPRGWAYVGSANMSESAWGRLVKDRATGKTKMTCRNWECGVLVPATEDGNRDPRMSLSMGEDANMFDIFRGTLPVPITAPGAKYNSGSSELEWKKPWFFLEG